MQTGANTRSSTLPTALGSGVPVVAVDGRETDRALFCDGDNMLFARALDGAAFAEAALHMPTLGRKDFEQRAIFNHASLA
jgi:hypothetical protein